MKFERSSGVLLHITSLSGKYGIGDIGESAYHFIDFLYQARCKYWQFLPLTYPGIGNSPYQGISAFAGNPSLISPDLLFQDGYIKKDDLLEKSFSNEKIDYRKVNHWKEVLFIKALNRFKEIKNKQDDFEEFCINNEDWIEDYALYSAIKREFSGQIWTKWPRLIKHRNNNALINSRNSLKEQILKHKFIQYIFSKQWNKLKEYAENKGIKLIGDLPLYISHDSADVWVNPDLFKLNNEGDPSVVAGVPPDYFSDSGQLWGNPVYDWEVNKLHNYSWWKRRIEKNLEQVDFLRLDHFRGYCSYWEVPSADVSAENGKWVSGPGIALFESFSQFRDPSSSFPFIAEDLGLIDNEVIALREKLGIPGMKIIQFAFLGEMDDKATEQYQKNSILYTGTHDNDTLKGWLEKISESELTNIKRFLNKKGEIGTQDLIVMAWESNANLVIIPMQDLLNLDSNARINIPGLQRNNWRWRLQINKKGLEDTKNKLLKLNYRYNRN